jgi:predicted site-specific integrase-resolvase
MQQANETDNDFLTTSPAARELEVSPQTVIQWHRQGKLKAIMTTNGVRLFLRSEIDRVKREREGRKRA